MIAVLKYTDCLQDGRNVFRVLANRNVEILKTKQGCSIYPQITIRISNQNELSQLLYFHFVEFCRRHFVDLNKMDYLSFSVENIKDSISYGGWSPSSDSSFTLYNKGRKNIVCSM